MEYISKKEFAQLKGKDIKVTKVYGPYRKGWNEGLERYETFKTWSEDEMHIWKDGEEVAIEGKVDFKIHKKKYDIVVELEKKASVKISKWNKELGEKEDLTVKDTEFTVKEISATMLGDMMACGVAFGNVPEDEEGRRVFDWEEMFISALEGSVVKFATEKKDWSIGDKSGKYDAFTFVSVSNSEPDAVVVEDEDDRF